MIVFFAELRYYIGFSYLVYLFNNFIGGIYYDKD